MLDASYTYLAIHERGFTPCMKPGFYIHTLDDSQNPYCMREREKSEKGFFDYAMDDELKNVMADPSLQTFVVF